MHDEYKSGILLLRGKVDMQFGVSRFAQLAVLRIRMTGIMRTLTEKLSVFSRSQIDRTGARWGHKVVASTEHSTVVGNSNGHRGHVVESGDSSEVRNIQ